MSPAFALAAAAPDGGAGEWSGPGSRHGRPRPRWRRLLWALLFPPRAHRIAPTIAGALLVAVALGIGLAAYNTGNNILFITLSLLLSCLILSGVLSWANLRGVGWRLQAEGPWRSGQTQTVGLELRNTKRLLPTYGLWFDLSAGAWTARRHLESRLDPGETTRLEWAVEAGPRGSLRVGLAAVGSLYPFGFLRKSLLSDLAREVLVWPAPVEYRRLGAGLAWRPSRSEGAVNRAGQGGDLHSLRPYVRGDSPRLVHWKASARLRHLFIRQFTAEGLEGFVLHLDPDAALWPRPAQFELAVALAGTLAEDLFKVERIQAVILGHEDPRPIRRLRDVESFLDRLALVEPVRTDKVRPAPRSAPGRRLLELQPDGARGVVALLDGKPAASA